MRVLVVGGGAAGMSCASLVKRRDPEADVTVLERGGFVSFSACGIPYWLGGTVEGDADRLVVLDPEEARQERGIDVRTGIEVETVDAQDRTLEARSDGERQTLAYDRLVLATGVEAVDPFEAEEADNVLTFRHLDDGVRAQEVLSSRSPDEACVIGGGLVGIEISESLADRGIETTLVEAGEALLGDRLAPELGEQLTERLRGADVAVRCGQRAEAIEVTDGAAEAVVLPDETIGADLVVVAVGTQPRTRLAEEADCSIADAGGILTDQRMRTDVDDVLACGDGVAYPHRVSGERVVQPLALHANRSGRVAGETIAGGEATFPGVLGTAVAQFGDTEVALTGLNEAQARDAGYEAVSATIEARTKAGYMPGAAPVHVHLVAEEATGRVLGGQIVGGHGAGKRIDTIAAATWMEATCEEVEAMDLAYTPPLSPTWDPVAIAARMAAREVGT